MEMEVAEGEITEITEKIIPFYNSLGLGNSWMAAFNVSPTDFLIPYWVLAKENEKQGGKLQPFPSKAIQQIDVCDTTMACAFGIVWLQSPIPRY